MSQNDVLATLIRAVVGLPPQFLGLTLKYCKKLSGKDGGYWYEKLRLLICEPVIMSVPAVVVQTTNTITVLGGFTIPERIAEANLGIDGGSFTDQDYPHDSTSVGEWEWKLLCFRRKIETRNKALTAIHDEGWEPAKIEQLIAFSGKYPNEQRMYKIYGLGSQNVFLRYVQLLTSYGLDRALEERRSSRGFDRESRFLVVRRIPKE